MKPTPYLQFVVNKLSASGQVTTRHMMDGFLIYLNGMYIGCVDNDVFYLKRFPENELFLKDCPMASPYAGAKPSFTPPLAQDDSDAEFIQKAVYLTFLGAVNAQKPDSSSKKKS